MLFIRSFASIHAERTVRKIWDQTFNHSGTYEFL